MGCFSPSCDRAVRPSSRGNDEREFNPSTPRFQLPTAGACAATAATLVPLPQESMFLNSVVSDRTNGGFQSDRHMSPMGSSLAINGVGFAQGSIGRQFGGATVDKGAPSHD